MCSLYDPPGLMSDLELVRELASLCDVSVRVLSRGADVYRELIRRGIPFNIKHTLMADLLPRIAEGRLATEAVAAFVSMPKLFRTIARLTADVQKQLAEGAEVLVVLSIGEPPVPMPARDTVGLNYVFAGDRIATVAEQERALDAIQRRRAGGARLIRRMEVMMRERKIETLTARQAVEMAVSLGWGRLRKP